MHTIDGQKNSETEKKGDPLCEGRRDCDILGGRELHSLIRLAINTVCHDCDLILVVVSWGEWLLKSDDVPSQPGTLKYFSAFRGREMIGRRKVRRS